MKMRRTFPVTGGSNGGVITKFLICTLLLSRFRPERFNTSEFGMFDCPSQPQEDRCRDTRRPGPAPDQSVRTLQTPNKRPQRLFDHLRGKHILVLGCGFPDWLARFFLELVTDIWSPAQRIAKTLIDQSRIVFSWLVLLGSKDTIHWR